MKILFLALCTIFMLPILAMDAPSTLEQDWAEQLRLSQETRMIQKRFTDQLITAIHQEDYSTIEQLLAQNTHSQIQANLSSALSVATNKQNYRICQLLIEHGADPGNNNLYNSALYNAVSMGNLEIFKLFMNVIIFQRTATWENRWNSHDPQSTPPNKHTVSFETGGHLICLAAEYNYFEICRLLLGAGISPNRCDANGESPLSRAACQGNVRLCKLLIGAKANIESKNRFEDTTPLLGAAGHGREQVCSLLLNAGANIDAENHFGHNALIKSANSTIRKLIITHATKGHLDLRLVWAAHHYSGHRLNYEICRLLLNDQAEINNRMKTTLLCLNRMRNGGDEGARLLYRQLNALLRPYLEEYIPLKRLIDARDADGKQAYDYLQLDFLKPEEPRLLDKCVVQ